MTTKSETKAISNGICRFCQSEIAKSKMTHHLKSCKQRFATNAAKAQNNPDLQPTKLFHIVAEGRYNPEYWIHLEIPASDTLEDLDLLLCGIWLSCCGHSSKFKIGIANYQSKQDWSYSMYNEEDEDEDDKTEENIDEENEVEAAIKEVEAAIKKVEVLEDHILSIFSYPGHASRMQSQIQSEIISEMRKCASVNDLLDFLQEELKNANAASREAEASNSSDKHSCYLRQLALEAIIRKVGERDMSVQLEKVLKIGKKFSHEYDFGSTTYLKLRVASERTGIVLDDDDPILARNIPPVIPCLICGEPAKRIVPDYYGNDNAYCSGRCAKKKDVDYEETLPIVNSPRVGVCAYTG